MSTSTRAIVDELHRAYRDGDGARVAALIHEDIDWCIYGPDEVFPFEGPRKGKAQVLDVLAAIAASFELKSYQPGIVVVEGDRAAVTVEASFVQRTSGRVVNLHIANFLRIADGQVIEFKEFSDSFNAVQQVIGVRLEVPQIFA